MICKNEHMQGFTACAKINGVYDVTCVSQDEMCLPMPDDSKVIRCVKYRDTKNISVRGA